MQIGFKSTLQSFVLSTLFLFSVFSPYASASSLKVGTYPCPPFVIGSVDSELNGLSIELWEQIAKEMNAEFTFENHPLDDLLNSIETEQIDIGVSCISITPERELFADFSHSFYETHLAIAVKKPRVPTFLTIDLHEPCIVVNRWRDHFGCRFSWGVFLRDRRREK